MLYMEVSSGAHACHILFTARLLQGVMYFYFDPGVLEHMQTKVPCLSATDYNRAGLTRSPEKRVQMLRSLV